MGGSNFASDEEFLQGGINDVRLLEEAAGLTGDDVVFDWGCGVGRLLVGIRQTLGNVRSYHGVDVQPDLIAWASANLADSHAKFSLSDTYNERYNPDGLKGPYLPAAPESVDVFYAYSVFSHMLEAHTSMYLQALSSCLQWSGRAMITAFVEDDVPACVENPSSYGPLEWSGRLHCVLYNKRFFEALISAAGLQVTSFSHGVETDGQSRYVLAKEVVLDSNDAALASGKPTAAGSRPSGVSQL